MTTTVVLASYNGEKYILEQLDSIRNQTEQVDEVLICDDCSTDNTYNLISEYITTYNLANWTLTANASNVGWKTNFANLILRARGDIIFLCDQDDVWHMDKVNKMKNAMAVYGDALVVSDLEVEYCGSGLHKYKQEKLGESLSGHVKAEAIRFRIMRPGCTFAVRRDFAKTCINAFWEADIPHDLLLWQCAFYTNSIGYVALPLIKYRRNSECQTAKKSSKKIDDRIDETNAILGCAEAIKDIRSWNSTVKKNVRLANRCIKLEKHRRNVFVNGSFGEWIRCLKYINCYLCKRSWLVDLTMLGKAK